MYQKSKLSFKNQTIFEKAFRPNIDKAFCVVSKMMFFNTINVDGSINPEKESQLHKYELWSYIYYLYYYNNTSVEEFARMKNPDNGKANAVRFYRSVQEVVQNSFVPDDKILPFDVRTLSFFINTLIHKYGNDLRNPVVDYLQQLLNNKEAMAQLKKFTLVTGQPPGNVSIVTDPQNVRRSNIRVTLGYSD